MAADPAAGSFLKTSALVWGDEVSSNSLWNIMAFLCIVWKLKFTHTAAIMSVMGGCMKVLSMPMSFILHAFLGHYQMLSLSSLSLTLGWSLLAISTSTIFLKMPVASCENYQLCIGDIQWFLFYASLALIVVGIVGHSISLQEFLNEQLSIRSMEDAEQLERDRPQLVASASMTTFVRLFCTFVLPFIEPWGARFGIPAFCVAAATFLFFRGSSGYVQVELSGSPIIRVFRVIVASCLKLWVPIPKDPRELYAKYDHENEELLSHTNRLRFLDKAAILSRSQTIEEQENQKWRLCTVTEVEETKIFFQMIPMWMTFIICGLVLSVGNTYFLQQAFNMNPRFLFITIQFLVFLREFSKSLSTHIFSFIAIMAHTFGGVKPKYIPAIGIAAGMFISIICCIVAALVESMRLSRIATTPMSIFWLIPQFILFGTMTGIVEDNILLFVVIQSPDSMKMSMSLLTVGVLGVGMISSVLSVYVTGHVSAEKWGQSWFGETIDKSRLDNYYWLLSGMSFINLVLYGLVAFWFDYKELESSSIRSQQQQDVNEGMLHYHEE
ncbi:Protein NRT1/ PTR FAMILY 5.5 like [Actinidia chinensis var. chinensis]|uniref:Protein NRT1/ PTR FAMILY 5.5 like n=1 Tax=Actinidia chinensis var. chinensis TaxID=1590841 RepID=A0A2R6PGF6_ACTCC|nr:Protein NRT1/ PTR FAMILY 5.5 like [Actinidia chinensis var. chinensis]